VLIDIASPGDIDPAAGRLANVFLYDLDALGAITEQNRNQREKEIPKAERIVDEEHRRFFEWYETLAVKPVIRALRKNFEEIGRREARKHGKQFHRTDRDALERYTQALISKLLHHPTLGLKDLDRSTPEGFGKLAAMQDLFRLETDGDGPRSAADGESQ
jgi:glutamyl-tRNA reductase